MRIIFLFVPFLFISIILQGQTIGDAARYSVTSIGGTARTVGVGGSLGAFGTDFSVINSNPAGLASYRRSEFTFTPNMFIGNSDADLRDGGRTVNDSKNNFNVNNIGVVFAKQPIGSKWKTFNIGFGYSRIATYQQRFKYEGTSTGSISDRWVEDANDGIFDDFGSNLALDAGAVYNINGCDEDFFFNDYNGINGDCTVDFSNPIAIDREQEVRTEGAMTEMVFAFAGNYNEKLMVGATIGVPFISFDEDRVYRETDPTDDVPFFNAIRFNEELSTSGIGINLKLGANYRVNQMVRIGGAVHTPTKFSLTDNFSNSLTYDYTDNGEDFITDAESPEGNFEYTFKTPWRFIGNAGVLIARKGFISAEIEYVNFKSAEFDLTTNSDSPEDRAYQDLLNDDIASEFGSGVNIRIGGEYVLAEKFRLRAGYKLENTAFANDDTTIGTASVGLGYRGNAVFVDVAYTRSSVDETFAPYTLANGDFPQLVDIESTNGNVYLTLGFRF